MCPTVATRVFDGRRQVLLGLAIGAIALIASTVGRSAETGTSAIEVLEQLRGFRQLGTVLFIAAHPDDENTQLIAYLACGPHYRTAYLSVTRGDGGQNLLGPQFGEQLGVIRTQELLAARRIDGGRQFFTRAIDFGYSKSDAETLAIWDHQQVLADVVRIMRTLRPDVVITRFSPRPSGTHGHHTASAVLGLEAFKLTGDPKAFPEQLDQLQVWQPKRILQNGGGRGRGSDPSADAPAVSMDVDGEDAVLGISFGEIASRSRGMHKSQGFGQGGPGGAGGGGGGRRSESFTLLAGEPAKQDIFDGIETTWRRISGGEEIDRLTSTAIDQFDSQNLEANVPRLLEIRKHLASLPAEPLVAEKGRDLDRILQACLGLTAETQIDRAEVVPGEPVAMRHKVAKKAETPVRWVSVRYKGAKTELAVGDELPSSGAIEKESTQTLPGDVPLTKPYWLKEPGTVGMSRVDDPGKIGTPDNAPAFPCEFAFDVAGQTLVVADQPLTAADGNEKDSRPEPLAVISPTSVAFASGVKVFPPGGAAQVELIVEAHRPDITGVGRLNMPSGWSVSPATQPFRLAKVGDRQSLAFQVTAPSRAENAELTAEVEINGARFDTSRIDIAFAHIPRQILQPRAQLKAVSLDLAIRGHRVGYIPGAGDEVAELIHQMGYEVTELSGGDLTSEGLKGFDAVVTGIRALNTRDDLAEHMPALFAFVESGGNVVMQYNRPNGVRVPNFSPYKLRLSGLRTTDETAAPLRLAPDHPALNSPNKIVNADFDGWVQERGIYYPDEWDSHFTPIIAFADPGESPQEGGILVADYGRGHFIYTSLAWFRQLPAGVPGAYRLFANLVSLGK